MEDAVAQNVRIRQVLHCVGTNIREYEDVQSGLSKLLGVPYVRISSEVLEALSHDPAAVTTKTRMFASWRAVEDIYARVVRQRETLRAFADSLPMQSTLATSRSVFEDPIKSLMQSLEQLEIHRRHITRESEAVAGILTRVKNVHSKVKKGYNETLSHTSLVYPEVLHICSPPLQYLILYLQLSQIIALEESYRNHYQQVSNLALDALTLLLDTVTPFWRNYGKVIGVDAQDFLIIPWYRNEFTGEPKRYPIKTFPCRSLRHWLGLLVLYVLSAVVTFLQIRGAISSTLNYNLPWITHTGFRWMFIPVFIIIIIIQWIAAFFESCILVAELGVVVWWMGWSVKIFD